MYLNLLLAHFLLVTKSIAVHAINQCQFTKTGLSDRKFMEHLLFSTSSRGLLDCSLMCIAHAPCLAFTYLGKASDPARLCQGHARPVGPLSGWVTSTGAVTYEVDVGSKTDFAPSTALPVTHSGEDSVTSTDAVTYQTTGVSTDVPAPSTALPVTLSGEDSVTSTDAVTHQATSVSTDVSTPSTSLEGIHPDEDPATSTTAKNEQGNGDNTSGNNPKNVDPTRDWLGSTCSEVTGCPVQNSRCIFGRCFCTPGYYYTERRRLCSETCPSAYLLHKTTSRYQGVRISGSKLDGKSNTDPNGSQSTGSRTPDGVITIFKTAAVGPCEMTCLDNSYCRSASFFMSQWDGSCILMNVTALAFTSVDYNAGTSAIYFQKHCQ